SPSPHSAPWPRIRVRALTRRRTLAGTAERAGTRIALHLPQREHFASIRVLAECVDHKYEVLRTDRRTRSTGGQSRGRTGARRCRQFHDPERGRLTAPHLGPAAICHRARWRLFLSSKPARPTLLRRSRERAGIARVKAARALRDGTVGLRSAAYMAQRVLLFATPIQFLRQIGVDLPGF